MEISNEERDIRLNEMRRWCRSYNLAHKTNFCSYVCPFHVGKYCSIGLEISKYGSAKEYIQAIELNTKLMDEWYEKFYQLTLDKVEDM